MYVGLPVKYLLFLPDFNQTGVYRKILLQAPNINHHEIYSVGSRRTDGRHDESNSRFS